MYALDTYKNSIRKKRHQSLQMARSQKGIHLCVLGTQLACVCLSKRETTEEAPSHSLNWNTYCVHGLKGIFWNIAFYIYFYFLFFAVKHTSSDGPSEIEDCSFVSILLSHLAVELPAWNWEQPQLTLPSLEASWCTVLWGKSRAWLNSSLAPTEDVFMLNSLMNKVCILKSRMCMLLRLQPELIPGNTRPCSLPHRAFPKSIIIVSWWQSLSSVGSHQSSWLVAPSRQKDGREGWKGQESLPGWGCLEIWTSLPAFSSAKSPLKLGQDMQRQQNKNTQCPGVTWG